MNKLERMALISQIKEQIESQFAQRLKLSLCDYWEQFKDYDESHLKKLLLGEDKKTTKLLVNDQEIQEIAGETKFSYITYSDWSFSKNKFDEKGNMIGDNNTYARFISDEDALNFLAKKEEKTRAKIYSFLNLETIDSTRLSKIETEDLLSIYKLLKELDLVD